MQATHWGCALFLAAALAASPSFAREQAPEAMLKAAATEVGSILRQQGKRKGGSTARAAERVQQSVLPLFDFPRMTEAVAARHWRLASPEQQKRLTAEFRTLVARTYSAALANQADQAIDYQRSRTAPGDVHVRVRSDARQQGGERMTIDYDMENTAEGWKIYDIKLRGVSLIATYRESFADAVRDRGLNGLIGLLSADNRQSGASVWTGGAAPQGQSLIALAVLYSTLQGRR